MLQKAVLDPFTFEGGWVGGGAQKSLTRTDPNEVHGDDELASADEGPSDMNNKKCDKSKNQHVEVKEGSMRPRFDEIRTQMKILT